MKELRELKFTPINIEVSNSRATKSSNETQLHKMTSHCELLTRKRL